MRVEEVALADEAPKRFLNYALSVVTSRALPDVRDGLKPVQRRILYTMHLGGHRHDEKYVKCARIVGDVMGKFHPHGDAAIYEALARMAQPFTLRLPLIDGQGNFGSPDGDAPAAMRYTEARLSRSAEELLSELNKNTVDFRPNYDGSEEEPIVLPARFPNLLINGSAGIAVGMATSIPPHNPAEVLDGAIAMIDNPAIDTRGLMKFIRGPDFPTGGEIVAKKEELLGIYESGQGTIKLRGTWKVEEPKGRNAHPLLVLTSIPYGVERRAVVEAIAKLVLNKELPQVLDVRDESTEETRIVCELKRGSDPEAVVAFLAKHTPFQTNIPINLTCLVPLREGGQLFLLPSRLSLRDILRHFLDFRMEVVLRRIQHDLAQLRKRIHVLEGFATIFDALDETIRIIRQSEGKADAARKLIARFGLSEEQVDAILELKLYRLARLEILVIREELEAKRKEASQLEALLANPAARWALIRDELLEMRKNLSTKRLTRLGGTEFEVDLESLIPDEDQYVVLTKQGWIKRQGKIDLTSTRLREGDALLDVTAGSTKHPIAFFSNQGSAYVCRILDIPQTTGFGEPLQNLFRLADGERVIRMLSFDPRLLEVPPPSEEEGSAPPHAALVTRLGHGFRFSLRQHRDPSSRSGRRFARVDHPEDEVVFVGPCADEDRIAFLTAKGRLLVLKGKDLPILGGPGKGVRLIRLGEEGDGVVGAWVIREGEAPWAPSVELENGKRFEIPPDRLNPGIRGSRGIEVWKRGRAIGLVEPPKTLPILGESKKGGR
ncbi:MAG: DNA topoisomerase IV subunit A [Sandaracinaceae bacterium]|nr:DNA topoisomerase IV subunit A [Sandaracinaceae bacterium]